MAKKNRKRNPQNERPQLTLEASYYNRLKFIAGFIGDDNQTQRNTAIENGDLILIPAPQFVYATNEYDIWIGDKCEWSQKRSIFAPYPEETVIEYRRRIAGIPKLHLYMKAFCGKRIGCQSSYSNFSSARQLDLLWHMWAENGYLRCASFHDIGECSFALDKSLLKKWINSWQGV